jgi:hypothetical protein
MGSERFTTQEEEVLFRVNTNGLIDYRSLVSNVKIDKRNICSLTSKNLRTVLFGADSRDLGSSFNTRIPSKSWISFSKSKMDHTSRNLWYRIIQKKMSDKITMHGMNLVDSERCAFCNQAEDTLHMLFTCDHKSDIWYKFIKVFIGYPQQIFWTACMVALQTSHCQDIPF